MSIGAEVNGGLVHKPQGEQLPKRLEHKSQGQVGDGQAAETDNLGRPATET